jgi:PTS system nitrogen regulatory IIA component
MVKIKFLSMATLPTIPAMAEIIADQFNLNNKDVLAVMQAREALGSTAIAEDMIMPHVELPNLAVQGLSFINAQSKYALILVIDSQNPDNQLIDILGELLQSEMLIKLKQVTSQQALEKFIKEVSLNVIR